VAGPPPGHLVRPDTKPGQTSPGIFGEETAQAQAALKLAGQISLRCRTGSYRMAGALGERGADLCPEENSVSSRPFPRSCALAGAFGGTRGVLGAIAAAALVTIAASGCGTSATPTAAATSAASPGTGASAYLACLEQHGVTVPIARPTARPTAFPSASSAMMKARQACASLRPKGGFGGRGGFGGFGAALSAFRTCMADHGETIPTTRPTARPAPEPSASPRADRFLNGLNPSNPKVAAAVKACQSELPAFPRPAPSPTG
jgi:hypothetical protein